MKKDPYEGFEEIYDYFYTQTEDIEFYLKLAEKYGDPILELGCGTGRILIPLARKGFMVTGLDISESMLSILKKKLEKEDEEVKKRVKIVLGDVRDFVLEEKFKLIIMPFSTIVHLLTFDDVLKTFENVIEHLEDNGLFVFDVFIPKLEYITQRERTIFDIREVKGKKIILWEVARYDLTNHLLHVKRYVELLDGERTKKFVWETVLRYWFKTELELLAKLAGFTKINVYGGFDLQEYRYDKNRMVFFLEE